MAKVINRDKPLEERLRALGIDYDFIKFLLYWCHLLGSQKKPADQKLKKYFGEKNIFFDESLFARVPFSNPKNRPPKVALWLAVSYLSDYFRISTDYPNWRLIEEFLQLFKLWGKSSLKSEWFKKGKKTVNSYDSESYRPSIEELLKFYNCHKKHILRTIKEGSVASLEEKPIFWSVKLIYSD